MKKLKRLLCTLLSVLLLTAAVPVTAAAAAETQTAIAGSNGDEYEGDKVYEGEETDDGEGDQPYQGDIQPGETLSIHNGRWVFFVPKKSGWYAFTSIGDHNTQAYLEWYNDKSEKFESIFDDNGGENRNFLIVFYCVAGQTYQLSAYSADSGDEDEFTVTVVESQPAASFSISDNCEQIRTASTVNLTLDTTPLYGYVGNITVTVSDPTVLSYQNSCALYGALEGLHPGTAEVTVTTDRGLTAKRTVTVVAPSLNEDTYKFSYPVNNEHECKGYFSFTPQESGFYEFEINTESTYHIEDRDYQKSSSWRSDETVENAQKCIGFPHIYYCEAGKTCIVSVAERDSIIRYDKEYEIIDGFRGIAKRLTQLSDALILNMDRPFVLQTESQEEMPLKAIPDDGLFDLVTWESSDEDIVSVENGMIYGNKAGTATVTATTLFGVKATCTVTVTDAKIIKGDGESAYGDNGTVIFVPKESGYFRINDDSRYEFNLCDDEGNVLTKSTVRQEGQRYADCEYYCEKGRTYYINAIGFDENDPFYTEVHRVKLRGDADNDGVVTINDVTMIQRYLAEFNIADKAWVECCGDVTGDDVVSINDVTAIQRYLTNIDTPYDIGEEIVTADPSPDDDNGHNGDDNGGYDNKDDYDIPFHWD